MTHFDIVHTHFGTVHTLFTSYDTVHTHFDIVHTHCCTVHTLFTVYDTVHTNLTCCSWKALITSPVGFTSDLSTDVTACFIYFSYTNHPSTTPCSMMLHYITRFSCTYKLQLTYLGELGATGVRGKV